MNEKPNHSPKNRHIAPEDMKVNTCYAMTISPNDNMQLFDQRNTNLRLATFKAHMVSYLNKVLYPYTSDYLFNIELSQTGRLHLHGVIRVNDILGLYTMGIPTLIKNTSTEMDTIQHPDKWIKYCTKQAHIFGPFSPLIDREDKVVLVSSPKKEYAQDVMSDMFPLDKKSESNK